jgi:hypothetical protein
METEVQKAFADYCEEATRETEEALNNGQVTQPQRPQDLYPNIPLLLRSGVVSYLTVGQGKFPERGVIPELDILWDNIKQVHRICWKCYLMKIDKDPSNTKKHYTDYMYAMDSEVSQMLTRVHSAIFEYNSKM